MIGGERHVQGKFRKEIINILLRKNLFLVIFLNNIAGRHLKRIECLPKGISPSTLLLSNNEISKVDNLQYFVHLQQVRRVKS